MPNTAKKEAISKAWGVHYAEDIDENGWRESNVGSLGWDKEYFDIMKKYENTYVIRPKSLNGIVTNNGWIRIESEEDLPSGDMDVFVLINSKIESDYYLVHHNNFKYFNWYECTHYQPIVKPENPIY